MNAAIPTVFIVDSNAAALAWMRGVLASLPFPVASFARFQEFLHVHPADATGCLLLDLRLPDVDALEVLKVLRARESFLSVAVVTAHGDVATAVRALKAGAFDFLEKPCNVQVFLECVRQGMRVSVRIRDVRREAERIRALKARLSPREREVKEMMVAGQTTKGLAARLGIRLKTAEGHRTAVMRKMEVDTVAALVRMALFQAATEAGALLPAAGTDSFHRFMDFVQSISLAMNSTGEGESAE